MAACTRASHSEGATINACATSAPSPMRAASSAPRGDGCTARAITPTTPSTVIDSESADVTARRPAVARLRSGAPVTRGRSAAIRTQPVSTSARSKTWKVTRRLKSASPPGADHTTVPAAIGTSTIVATSSASATSEGDVVAAGTARTRWRRPRVSHSRSGPGAEARPRPRWAGATSCVLRRHPAPRLESHTEKCKHAFDGLRCRDRLPFVTSKLVVQGAREHNLKNVDVSLPATNSSCSPGFPVRASRRWRSTRSMPKGSGATSSRCRPTPGSSSGRWTSPTSISSKACRRRSRSTRSRPPATLARPSAPSPRSTTTCACCTRIGIPHDPETGERLIRQTPQQIVDRIMELPDGTRFQVLAPVVRGRKGHLRHVARRPRVQGLPTRAGRRRHARPQRTRRCASRWGGRRPRPRPLRDAHDQGGRRSARAAARHRAPA